MVSGRLLVAATRLAMLALATVGAMVTLSLGLRMGLPAGAASPGRGFLCISPLSFAQSMMAQLDLPAMVFLMLALLLFLEDRIIAAALVSVLLVLVKETGLLRRPIWLVVMDRRPPARSAVVSLAGLAAACLADCARPRDWPLVRQRGLHAVQYLVSASSGAPAAGAATAAYYLFIGTGHWIGTIAVILTLRNTKVFTLAPGAWQAGSWQGMCSW